MNPMRRELLAGLGVGIAGLAGCAAPSNGGPQQGGSGYTDTYNAVVDSIVAIEVSDREQNAGQGSGFVIDGRIIVTNHHVIQAGSDISVQFSNREWAKASVLGSDPHSDLAVLAVDDSVTFPEPLEFVDEPTPVGQEVLAIGSPFDLSNSLSQGIISGRNRSIPGPGSYLVPDTIQTDVALNPGSSGGPIVDLNGRVVGIVVANQGETVGFAISAELAKRVIPELRDTGSYEHSHLGITMLEVGPELAAANGLAEPGGLLIVEVIPEGPSDGVLQPSVESADSPDEDDSSADDSLDQQQPPEAETPSEEELPTGGDVIIELNGNPIPNSDALSRILALETRPGETVPVTIIRDGERVTVEVTLGSRPTE